MTIKFTRDELARLYGCKHLNDSAERTVELLTIPGPVSARCFTISESPNLQRTSLGLYLYTHRVYCHYCTPKDIDP